MSGNVLPVLEDDKRIRALPGSPQYKRTSATTEPKPVLMQKLQKGSQRTQGARQPSIIDSVEELVAHVMVPAVALTAQDPQALPRPDSKPLLC